MSGESAVRPSISGWPASRVPAENGAVDTVPSEVAALEVMPSIVPKIRLQKITTACHPGARHGRPWRESQGRRGLSHGRRVVLRARRKSYDCDAVVLFSLVATHADIDLETVAQLSTGASELATSALSGSPAVTGAVVLATCNRFEIYGEAPHADDVEAARAALVAQISELQRAQRTARLPVLQHPHRRAKSASTSSPSARAWTRPWWANAKSPARCAAP